MLLAALGYWDQATDILAGFEPWQLQGSGAALFVVSVVMILYRWDQEKVQKVTTNVPPKAVAQAHQPTQKTVGGNPDLPFIPSLEERVFVPDDITPATLLELCEEKTGIQIAHLVSPYMGKWVRAEGTISNIHDHGESLRVALNVARRFRNTEISTTIWLEFRGDRERLEMMQVGGRLRAIGKIERVSSATIELSDCELVRD